MKIAVLLVVLSALAILAKPSRDLSSDTESGLPSALKKTRAMRLDSSDVYKIFGVQNHDDVPEYEIVYPKLLTEEGAVAITSDESPADSLQITVDAFGETLHLNLRHDDGGVVTREMVRVSAEGEFTIPLRTDRLYSGLVTSDPESIVSAETSHGLTAIIFYDKGTLVVQPLSGKYAREMKTLGLGHPHVVYKGSDDDVSCGVEDEILDDSTEDEVGFESISCDDQSTKYLELAMFYDYPAWQKSGDTFYSEYLALFNLVKGVFQKPSLVGAKLVPKLVYAAYFADENVFKSSNESMGATLRAAKEYCRTANPPKSDPQHWDNAAFVTGYSGLGKTGLAVLGSCGKKSSVSVTSHRTVSGMAGTMCHEIGHNLSMKHDIPVECGPDKYIMHPVANKNKVNWGWSSCSRDYYCAFIGKKTCYDDA